MDPLSASTRRRYFLLFIAFFILVIPVALFYASGYRLDGGLSLVKTGGVYIAVPVSGASVSINGRSLGESSIFNRTFYEADLNPGSYALLVSLDGYYPWYKTLIVEPYLVTDTQALLIPQQLEVLELLRGAASSTASTTRGISRTQYDAYLAAFVPATTTKAVKVQATTTPDSLVPLPDDEQSGFALYVEQGNVRLHWSRATSTIPSSMCISPTSCVRDFFVEKGKDDVINARFYSGGVLYASKQSGIYFAEADIRPTPLVVPVYPRRNADFRIMGGDLIVKDGTKLYLVSGF